jgi:hypothetical protein
MKKPIQIMNVELPVPEAADMTAKAAALGIPVAEYIGIQALAGAYGRLHPEVVAFVNQPKAGQFGTETRGA